MRWKWKWILIPLLVYAITASGGTIFHHYRRAKIARMFETAKREHLPLLVTHTEVRTWFTYRLHSLDGESVGLDPGNQWPIKPPAVSEDGRTVYYWTMIATEPKIHLWRFSIPDDRPVLVAKCDLMEMFDPQEKKGSEILGPPWRLEGDGEALSLLNVATGERKSLDLDGEAPWERSGTGYARYDFGYSPSGNRLFCLDRSIEWMYDVGLDEWSEVTKATTSDVLFVGSRDGALKAKVSERNPSTAGTKYDTDFIDTRTGATIRTVKDAACLCIGKRFAACIQYPSTASGIILKGRFVVRIFDMENGWTEQQVVLDEKGWVWPPRLWGFEVALLEP